MNLTRMKLFNKWLGICLILLLGSNLSAQKSSPNKPKALLRTESIIKWLKANGYKPNLDSDDNTYSIDFNIDGELIICNVDKAEDFISLHYSFSLSQDDNLQAAYLAANRISASNTFIRGYISTYSDGQLPDVIFDANLIPTGNSIPNQWLRSITKEMKTAIPAWKAFYKNTQP